MYNYNVSSNIVNIVKNFFSSREVSPFTFILIGFFIGFLVCILLYVIVLTSIIKKSFKTNSEEISNEEIKKLTLNAKKSFELESSLSKTNEKIEDVFNTCKVLINDIASCFFPTSEYPIYELSVEEIIILNKYVSDRVEKLFDHYLLRKFKNVKISNIIYYVSLKKKIENKKAVKAAKKVAPVIKVTLTVLKAPISLASKIVSGTIINSIVNKLCLTVIDIVGEETTKVYSKHVFKKEKELNLGIEKEILEMENMLGTVNKEE